MNEIYSVKTRRYRHSLWMNWIVSKEYLSLSECLPLSRRNNLAKCLVTLLTNCLAFQLSMLGNCFGLLPIVVVFFHSLQCFELSHTVSELPRLSKSHEKSIANRSFIWFSFTSATNIFLCAYNSVKVYIYEMVCQSFACENILLFSFEACVIYYLCLLFVLTICLF